MKKLTLLLSIFLTFSCQKDDLVLVNPNNPGPASLNSEAGLKAFALGIYEKPFGWALDGWLLVSMSHHRIMGDEIWIPWLNFYCRDTQQYSKVILPDGREFDNVYSPGLTQKEILQSGNNRSTFSGAFAWEWYGSYFTIGQANRLLATLNNSSDMIKFSGNPTTKINTLKGWAHWWKGYSYSLIGSMYISGLIIDDFGKTNGNYKDRTEIIKEAELNFNEAVQIFSQLNNDDDYQEIMTSVIPDFNENNKVVSPAMWIRIINTYKARNILVNKKVAEMSASDWTNILVLTDNGIQESDNILTLGIAPGGLNDLTIGMHPYQRCSDASGWGHVSERLIQEYKPGDQRLERNFHLIDVPTVNMRNRGWLFGTRYGFVDIEDGGSYATASSEGQLPITPTYEENQLMMAEALMRTGKIEEGLAKIDLIRKYQDAGIADVSGAGLNNSQAFEELRRERRVALALRGLAFYDARRLGIISPAEIGGGRQNAMIVIPTNIYDPEGDGLPDAYPCFVEYNYMEYWDIPANELDFNTPLPGSSNVKN